MYIGKEPIVGNFQKCDAITVVNGQAAYTLQVGGTNVVPESANHCLVSLNGILQAPVTSFTVSGSTLTFASNLATGDVIDFVILLGNVLDLGTPSDGTVTNAKLASDVISGETDIGGAIADADLFLVDDGAGGTLRKTAASRIATYIGDNTPAFEAYRGSSQGVTDNTATKVQFDTEVFDTDSTYDASTNFRFTPAVAGKYLCYSTVRGGNDGTGTLNLLTVKFYKNGSAHQTSTTQIIHFIDNPGANASVTITQIIDLDADDYVEVYATVDTTTGSPDVVQNSVFGAFKLIGI